MKFFRSLKFKITLWYVVIVAILVATSGLVAYFQLSSGLATKTVHPWNIRSAVIEKVGNNIILSDFSNVFDPESGLSSYRSVKGMEMAELTRLISEGKTVDLGTIEGTIAIDPGLLIDPATPQDAEIWLYLYGSAEQPGVYQLVQVNQTALAMAARLAYFQRTVLITAGSTLLLAAVLGFFLIRWLLRPLYAITRTAGSYDGRDVIRRLDVSRGDEIGELAATLNGMFDRVETAFTAERKVASDLSHEIRTPLAVMQTEATRALKKEPGDEAYQKALESVNREISHVTSVIERLLFLARTGHGGELVLSEFDLRDLMTEIGWDAEVLCENKGIIFQSNVPNIADPMGIQGDRTRLRECFLNLLDNAVRYTPAGGTISINLTTEETRAMITISDTGIGIAARHLPHIFERFYQVGGNKDGDGGAGLGLTICKRIAELHGGSITVKSKLRKGTAFTVYLPRQPRG